MNCIKNMDDLLLYSETLEGLKKELDMFLTLFYAESNPTYFRGGAYMPPMISRKKRFLPNSFCTPKQLPKIGVHTKTRSLPRKIALNAVNQICQVQSMLHCK